MDSIETSFSLVIYCLANSQASNIFLDKVGTDSMFSQCLNFTIFGLLLGGLYPAPSQGSEPPSFQAPKPEIHSVHYMHITLRSTWLTIPRHFCWSLPSNKRYYKVQLNGFADNLRSRH